MPDDITDIVDFYNRNPEAEQERLECHQLEYDLTVRYLREYLPRRGTVLEIGSATGRYTRYLAARRYLVTAVDVSEVLIRKCRQGLIDEGLEANVRLMVADARNLAELKGAQFDAILLMGPLYHLIDLQDRELALRESVGLLREGGIFVSSFLSRFGIMGDLIKDKPQWIEDRKLVRSFMKNGKRPDSAPRGGFRGYFAKAHEIAPFHEAAGLQMLTLAGVEPGIAADDASYNKLGKERRRLWLDLLHNISKDKAILGASRHLLYVGRKMAPRNNSDRLNKMCPFDGGRKKGGRSFPAAR